MHCSFVSQTYVTYCAIGRKLYTSCMFAIWNCIDLSFPVQGKSHHPTLGHSSPSADRWPVAWGTSLERVSSTEILLPETYS